MRRSKLIVALICFLAAMLLQLLDFASMGGLALIPRLLAIALLAVGTVIMWGEWRRSKSR